MGKELKVGDRVAVYGGIHNVDSSPNLNGAKATRIESLSDALEFPGNIRVRFDVPIQSSSGTNVTAYVHEKQCRRLVKKKPRRRIWVPNPDSGVVLSEVDRAAAGLNHYLEIDSEGSPRFTEFVEVHKPVKK